MLSHFRRLYERAVADVRSNKGQGLVEYALILVLIAIVVLVAVKGVGTSTKNAFTAINTGLQPPAP